MTVAEVTSGRSPDQVLQLLRVTGALLEGHFILTSGMHSGGYAQCAKILQYPQHAETLGRWIAESFHGMAVGVVISPAIGGDFLRGRKGAGLRGGGPLWGGGGGGGDPRPGLAGGAGGAGGGGGGEPPP